MKALVLLAALAPSAAAQFQQNTTDIPQGSPANASFTENVDFADVDLDGDWDAAFADGGDLGNDQNRIWINMGGLQGGAIGTFVDETLARLPAISDASRDVEFADIDADGDVDLFVANHSGTSNNACRFQINVGGAQGQTLGFFVDETATRWLGLGGPGSSVAPSAVLPGGGFIAFSGDGDFGDWDNDGDLDLVCSDYGPSFNGQLPTRLFLNDGAGRFSELNPAGTTLSVGGPALWAEGNYAPNTLAVDGSEADIAQATADLDLGDVDGDLDLDMLLGGVQDRPRFFANRREENGGTVSFRDRTAAQIATLASGSGAYEQEFADMDGDADLDLLGLNWAGFNDIVARNDGTGTFGSPYTLPSSGSDAEEIDAIDFDNDGDLDIYQANFSGSDQLWRNDTVGAGPFAFVFLGNQPGTAGISKDADACDVDGDGDYDVFSAFSSNSANVYLENVTQVPDTSAPYFGAIEALQDSGAGQGTRPVRAQVYDNAPYYVTWYNDTSLALTVNNVPIDSVPMRPSMGQVFRGELPRNLAGSVGYRVVSSDAYGNQATSAQQTYFSTYAPAYQIPFGAATNGSLGPPALGLLSVPFAGTPLYVFGVNAPTGTLWLLALKTAPLPAPVPVPGLALLNVDTASPDVLPLLAGFTGPNGLAILRFDLPPTLPSGVSIYAQYFTLDGVGGDLLASSRGLQIITQ